MYTQSRFFDPEQLSFKPISYPNIAMMQHSINQHPNNQAIQGTVNNPSYNNSISNSQINNQYSPQFGEKNMNIQNNNLQGHAYSHASFGGPQGPAHNHLAKTMNIISSYQNLQNQNNHVPLSSQQDSQASINNQAPAQHITNRSVDSQSRFDIQNP